MQFDSLELQKNIEEKRLIYGYKFGNFLTRMMLGFGKFLQNIVIGKNLAFYGCLTIFLVSILVRSCRDIGHDTGSYLEMGGKILAGGKYHHDFFEGNFPLALYLSTIPHILAKIFSIHLVIAAEIFYNFIGLVAIFAASLILRNSTLYDKKSLYNLILLAFSLGYFLRIFTLQFNEFGTKASYLLLFAYPYIAYQFPRRIAITITDKIICGLLAGLIFCTKPHYFLLVVAFEIAKIFDKKSIKCLISIGNFTTLLVIFGYLIWMLKYCPQYFEYIAMIRGVYAAYQSLEFWLISIFQIFVYNILPGLFLIILTFDLIRQDKDIKLLLVTFIGASLIAIAESLKAYDQLTSFYSLSLPLAGVVFYLLLKKDKINFSKNWFLIFAIIIISQFDIEVFAQLSSELVVLWWVVFLFISFSWRRFFKSNLANNQFFMESNFKKLNKIKDIILLDNGYLKIAFIILLVSTVTLSFSGKYFYFDYLLCFVILLLIITANEKLHQNFIAKNHYSKVTTIIIVIIFSRYLGLIVASIFNQYGLYGHYFKSPNYTNSEIMKTIIQYAKEDKKQTIIVAYGINGAYPILSYTNKKNPLPSHSLSALEDNIADSLNYNFHLGNNHKILKEGIFYGNSKNKIEARKYLFDHLKIAMASQDNSLLIIYKKHYVGYSDCRIGFLEYYLQDDEFRKIFFKNYHFLNRTIHSKNNNFVNNIEPAGKGRAKDGDLEVMIKNSENITTDIEIYARN